MVGSSLTSEDEVQGKRLSLRGFKPSQAQSDIRDTRPCMGGDPHFPESAARLVSTFFRRVGVVEHLFGESIRYRSIEGAGLVTRVFAPSHPRPVEL